MSHSYSKIWLHAIFSTKDRMPLIDLEIEQKVYEICKTQLTDIGCIVSIINGMPDHVHSLFALNPQKSVVDVIKQLKGGSSHSINESSLIAGKFAWQTGYAVYSVSESQLERVYYYIRNQKVHHQKKTFAQEYEDFIRVHGLSVDI